MSFIRVKSTKTGHEFDVNPEHAAKRDDWKVIDPTPVATPRPPKHSETAAKTAEPTPDTSTQEAAPVATGGDVKDDRLSRSSAK
jgi:hypothetical protein